MGSRSEGAAARVQLGKASAAAPAAAGWRKVPPLVIFVSSQDDFSFCDQLGRETTLFWLAAKVFLWRNRESGGPSGLPSRLGASRINKTAALQKMRTANRWRWKCTAQWMGSRISFWTRQLRISLT